MGTRRPIKVFVHDIGPTYSFASPDAAAARVAELIPEYAQVTVTDETDHRTMMTHLVVRPDRPPVVERYDMSVFNWVTGAIVPEHESTVRTFDAVIAAVADKVVIPGTVTSTVTCRSLTTEYVVKSPTLAVVWVYALGRGIDTSEPVSFHWPRTGDTPPGFGGLDDCEYLDGPCVCDCGYRMGSECMEAFLAGGPEAVVAYLTDRHGERAAAPV